MTNLRFIATKTTPEQTETKSDMDWEDVLNLAGKARTKKLAQFGFVSWNDGESHYSIKPSSRWAAVTDDGAEYAAGTEQEINDLLDDGEHDQLTKAYIN